MFQRIQGPFGRGRRFSELLGLIARIKLTASRINVNPKRLSDGHVADAKLVKMFGETIDGLLTCAHKRDRSNADGVVAQKVDVKEVANVFWHFVVDQTRHLLGMFDRIVHSLENQVGHKDLCKKRPLSVS